MMYAHKPTQAFYDSELYGNPGEPGCSLPDGAFLIDSDVARELAHARNNGMVLDWSGDLPVAVAQPAAPMTPELLAARIGRAMERKLDTLAKAWRYNNLDRAMAAASSPSPKFAAEGAAIVAYWSACWDILDALEASVASGDTPLPESVELVMAMLPPEPERPVAGGA